MLTLLSLSQPCEWRGAWSDVLVRGPAAGVWDHPSGKRRCKQAGVGSLKPTHVEEASCVGRPFLFFSYLKCQLSTLTWTQSRKVTCNIHQQMSLCRLHGDGWKCEMRPPWNPAERLGGIVGKNCAFTSFPNGLGLSVGSTFTNEHLFLLNPSFERTHCIQSSWPLVLYHPCEIFYYEAIKNTISALPLQKRKEAALIFSRGKSTADTVGVCSHVSFEIQSKYGIIAKHKCFS